MDVRSQVLDAAERMLDASPDRDISTRAVCEAVGIGAPTLYRLFEDKIGLLSAVVDHGFDRYLETKRAAPESDDPVQDLRAGWDTHIAFALAHPTVYRMLYSPAFADVPHAAGAALALLEKLLERCAARGLLQVEVAAAAQAIMSANIGVALSLVTQPKTYDDPGLSVRIRDAVHRCVLTAKAMGAAKPRAASTARVAVQLRALLADAPSNLTEGEAILMQEWLTRLARPARTTR